MLVVPLYNRPAQAFIPSLALRAVMSTLGTGRAPCFPALQLLEEQGHQYVMDLGDITTARGAEMLLPLWLRLYAALGTPDFNVKVVRAVE